MADLKAKPEDLVAQLQKVAARAKDLIDAELEDLLLQVRHASALLPRLQELAGLELLRAVAAAVAIPIEMPGGGTVDHFSLEVNGYRYQSRGMNPIPAGRYDAVILFVPRPPREGV